MANDGPASRPARTGGRSDAIEQLRREQLSIDKLFFAFHLLCERSDTEQEKRAIIERIHLELAVHLQVINDVVHPVLRRAGDGDKGLIDEAQRMHASVREMIASIVGQPAEHAERDARVEALGVFVQRELAHERTVLFPRLRQADIHLRELGRQLSDHRKALTKAYLAVMKGEAVIEDESADPVGGPDGPA